MLILTCFGSGEQKSAQLHPGRKVFNGIYAFSTG